jgi:hypothetical protein
MFPGHFAAGFSFTLTNVQLSVSDKFASMQQLFAGMCAGMHHVKETTGARCISNIRQTHHLAKCDWDSYGIHKLNVQHLCYSE